MQTRLQSTLVDFTWYTYRGIPQNRNVSLQTSQCHFHGRGSDGMEF